MEKLLKILKNKWFLLGISFLSLLYVLFVGNLVRLTFCFYAQVSNFASMMALYLLVNFIFGILMFFTRKQIPTIVCAVVAPFEVFALFITAFGQWYIIIPPLAVAAVMFLICGVGESCKTVLGTMFLIMYVVGGLVYSIMYYNFEITLDYVVYNYVLEDQSTEINPEQRSSDYLVSSDGTYRLVKYVNETDNRTTTVYYVEEASRDEEYPFVYFYYVFGCRRVLATVYDNDVSPRWLSDTVLYIDGKARDIEELFTKTEDAEDGESDEAENEDEAEDTDKTDTEDEAEEQEESD